MEVFVSNPAGHCGDTDVQLGVSISRLSGFEDLQRCLRGGIKLVVDFGMMSRSRRFGDLRETATR